MKNILVYTKDTGLMIRQHGFIEIITIIIIGVIALAYFNIDLRMIMSDPFIQKILGVLKDVWFNYLVPLGGYLKTSILGLFS